MSLARAVTIAVICAATVSMPFLGSVGLWDPWETHYAEVGREMLARGDWVHPFWQDHFFFSKPALTPWLAAVGLWLSRINLHGGELPAHAEWLIRLPCCLFSIGAVGLLAYAVARLASPRAGAAAGVSLSTMPLWLFFSRQATTDMAYVAPVTAALACFAVALFDGNQSPKKWALAGWGLCAVATLAKGLLGVALPLAVVALSAMLVGRSAWSQWRRLHPMLGAGLFCALATPWYAAMLAFDGLDNEGHTFFQRFVLHDHIARLAVGVHTDTPGGSFVYYVEQLGFGVFLWVGLLPSALSSLRAWLAGPRAPAPAIGAVTAGLGLVLFTTSATRLHHYCLPVLPGLAILCGLAADDLLERGLSAQRASVVVGAAAVALVARDLSAQPRRLIELFTYNHERPYPEELLQLPVFGPFNTRHLLLGFTAAAGALLLVALLRPLRPALVARVGAALAIACAGFLSWSHWVTFGHHWTQKELFARYWRESTGGEPIAAFFMDWKGETFYSQNTVVQLGPANYQRDTPAFLQHPGRKWVLVEHSRLPWLQQLVGPRHTVTAVEPELNNKFVLLAIDG